MVFTDWVVLQKFYLLKRLQEAGNPWAICRRLLEALFWPTKGAANKDWRRVQAYGGLPLCDPPWFCCCLYRKSEECRMYMNDGNRPAFGVAFLPEPSPAFAVSSARYFQCHSHNPENIAPYSDTSSSHMRLPRVQMLESFLAHPLLHSQKSPLYKHQDKAPAGWSSSLCISIRFTGDWRANRMEVESGTGRQPNYFRKNGNKKTPDFRNGKLAHQGWLLLCWITWNGNADFGSCLPVKETRLFWQM